jgi:hypothetical protein
MRIRPSTFSVRLSDAGYEWRRGEDSEPRLVPRIAPGLGYRQSDLASGTFLNFAATPSTKVAIQNFAGRYGLLFGPGKDEEIVVRDDHTITYGASLVTWNEEIAQMRILTELWVRIKNKEIAVLEPIIKWTQTDVSYKLKMPGRNRDVTLANARIPETRFESYTPNDVLLPARHALQREINLRLTEQSCIPALMWCRDYTQNLVLQPPNLLAVMWLQFAQAVADDLEFYACDACGDFFQRGPGGRRMDSFTCGDACRQAKRRRPK